MKTVVFTLSAALSCAVYGFGNAHLGVKVVDSVTGSPLSGLKVHGGFRNYSRGWNESAKDNNMDGVTGNDGLCHLSGNSEAGESCCIVRGNEGYYNSGWYSVEYAERSILKLGIEPGTVPTRDSHHPKFGWNRGLSPRAIPKRAKATRRRRAVTDSYIFSRCLRRAMATASVRFAAPIFVRMAATCSFTRSCRMPS